MLISGAHNASIGNKPFLEKLNSYQQNPLLNQQGEIKTLKSGDDSIPLWDIVAIEKRHKLIHDFATIKWSFDNFKITLLWIYLLELTLVRQEKVLFLLFLMIIGNLL